jgi:hypothetical protein
MWRSELMKWARRIGVAVALGCILYVLGTRPMLASNYRDRPEVSALRGTVMAQFLPVEGTKTPPRDAGDAQLRADCASSNLGDAAPRRRGSSSPAAGN